MENLEFQKGTLNAGENSLLYNTKPESKEGNIYTVLAGIEKEIVKDFDVIKGEIFYFNQNKREMKWAIEMGVKVNPYEIIDGVLISSDKNLFLMDEATGTITIPERVKSIGEGTFANLPGIKKIIIPPTCREIQTNAFYGNKTLEEIIILADGEKGIEIIGERAFQNCTNLKSVYMPNTVKELGNLVFSGCTNLSEVQLSNKIKLIPGEAFHYCENLHKLVIPEGVKMLDDFSIAGTDNLQIFLPASLETTSQTAFYGSRIEKIELDSNNPNLVCNSGILYNTNRNLMYAVEKKNIVR